MRHAELPGVCVLADQERKQRPRRGISYTEFELDALESRKDLAGDIDRFKQVDLNGSDIDNDGLDGFIGRLVQGARELDGGVELWSEGGVLTFADNRRCSELRLVKELG
ncbi:hypothetical protein BGZ54_003933 [Gamsiella multidivaricata]|nr:hypothetical protein BGZ54_003933 [Gamsiella multidivaricata]